MPGIVLNVCTSTRKGTPKRPVKEAFLRLEYGFDGDAHAGNWHRQVSVLNVADIRTMEAKGLRLRPGAFGENIVVSGLETSQLGIGSRLKVDEAELEISQIGKVCHNRCAIYSQTGDCIMLRHGLFASVTRPGAIRVGSKVEAVHTVSRHTVQAAVVRSAGAESWAGAATVMLRERLDAHIAWQGVAPVEETASFLRQLCGRGLDVVVVLAPGSEAGTDLMEAVQGEVDRVVDFPPSSAICGFCGTALIVALTDPVCGAHDSTNPVAGCLGHAIEAISKGCRRGP